MALDRLDRFSANYSYCSALDIMELDRWDPNDNRYREYKLSNL